MGRIESNAESLLAFVETNAGIHAAVTILLVDDDEDCRALLRDAISEASQEHNVVEVTDGEAALQYLRSHLDANDPAKPKLIFLDIEMPRLDGISVLREIKADPALRQIPVVMLTGVAEEEKMRQAAMYGANSYTIKPANAERFLETVLNSTRYWLTVHQYPDRHIRQEESRR